MNRYIIGQSSSGKTKSLLEAAREAGAVVVCRNPEAMRVKAYNYGIFNLDFCSYGEVYGLPEGPGNVKIVVDELKDLFASYGFDLTGFNLTED